MHLPRALRHINSDEGLIMEKGFVMHERLWSALYAVSLIVMGVCAAVTGINYIIAGDGGQGFLPDMAVRIMGIVQCAALFTLVFSHIKRNRRR